MEHVDNTVPMAIMLQDKISVLTVDQAITGMEANA